MYVIMTPCLPYFISMQERTFESIRVPSEPCMAPATLLCNTLIRPHQSALCDHWTEYRTPFKMLESRL